MDTIANKSLLHRIRNLIVSLGCAFFFIYAFLPFVTNSFDVLSTMTSHLEESGIDPTRYFYTDVEQVQEAVYYLDSALKKK